MCVRRRAWSVMRWGSLATVAALIGALLMVTIPSQKASAEPAGNIITVDSEQTDFGEGDWIQNSEGCHLRDAIRAANTNTAVGGCASGDPNDEQDIIVLAVDVPLFSTTPSITSSVAIRGNGHVIDGRNEFRLLDVSGGEVDISNVVLTHGFVTGATGTQGWQALCYVGTWPYPCAWEKLDTHDGEKGGSARGAAVRVRDGSAVSMDRVTITDNQVVGGNGGRSVIGGTGGTGGEAEGAAIYSDHSVIVITRSVIAGNHSKAGNGGAGGEGWPGAPGDPGACGELSPEETPTDGDDGGQGGSGGAGGEAGAAVYAQGGSISVGSAQISGNTATGGDGHSGGDGGDGGAGASLDCSSWLPPQAGTDTDGTWTSDDGETGPQGVHGVGGNATSSIQTFGAALTVTSSSITGNSASTGDGGEAWAASVNTVGGVQISGSSLVDNTTYIRDGDDKRSPDMWAQKAQGQSLPLTLTSSVIARNSVILNTDTIVSPWQCENSLTSDGHNVLSAQSTDGACVAPVDSDSEFAEGDLPDTPTDVDPRFHLPGDATTRVYVPASGSNLIGGGVCSADDIDQRGVMRAASGCDIGAYESGGASAPNTPPTAVSPVYVSGDGGDAFSVRLVDYFDDAETPDELTYSQTVVADNGAVDRMTLDSGWLIGSLSADVGQARNQIQVTGTDPGGGSAILIIVIDTHYDGTLEFSDDSYTLTEGTSLTLTAANGIFANDLGVGPGFDADTSGLEFASDDDSPGEITNIDTEEGTFTYTPPEDFVGMATFHYHFGILYAATITFTVVENPVAYDDEYIVAQGGSLTIDSVDEGFYANDTGIPENPLIEINDAQFFNEVADDGTFTVMLPVSVGRYTLEYRVIDDDNTGARSEWATVMFDVRDVDTVGESYALDEGTTLTVGANDGLRANDSGTAGFELTVDRHPEHGALMIRQDGSFSYAPDEGYVGADSFTYDYADGVNDAPVTASLTVRSTRVPMADDLAYTTDEDVPLIVDDVGDGLLGSASGFDTSDLTITMTTTPIAGTIEINDDGTFRYEPGENATGTDALKYTVSDGTNSVNVTASITLTPVNDAPLAGADTFGVRQGATLSLDAEQGVLRNDSDIDSSDLTATLGDGPAHGSITLSDDGSFVYTPDADFVGSDTFTYTVSDGTARSEGTANISVLADTGTETPPPSAVDDAYEMHQGTALSVGAPGVLANDEGTDVIAVLGILPAHGAVALNADGSFSYTPQAEWAGTDTFTYTVSSGSGVTKPATVTIVVHPAAGELTARNDAYSTAVDTELTVNAASGLRANDTWPDSESDAPSAVATGDPTSGTLTVSVDGNLTYAPEAGFVGTVSFEYVLETADGARSEPATVTIVVTLAESVAPTAGDDEYSGSEDAPIEADADTGVTANDDAGAHIVLVSGPSHGTLALETTGALTFQPDANWFGTDSFTYRAQTEGGVSEPATVTLTVTAVNDVPKPSNDAYAAEAGTPLIVSADSGVLVNDFDVDGDELKASAVTMQNHGQLKLMDDGSFVYTPPDGGSVDDIFTYTVSDGTEKATATVRFVVEAAPETVPTAITSADHTEFTMGEGGSFTLTATGDGPVTFGLGGAPSWVSITQAGISSLRTVAVPSSALLVGMPPEGSAGTYTFVVTAEAAGGTTEQSFTLDVVEPNAGEPDGGSGNGGDVPGSNDGGAGNSDDGGGTDSSAAQPPAASDQAGGNGSNFADDVNRALPYTGPTVNPFTWASNGILLLLIGGALLTVSQRRRKRRS